jgi:hypothetical protein
MFLLFVMITIAYCDEDYDKRMCVQYIEGEFCPRPYDYIESIALSLEKNLFPKIEVLIQKKIPVKGFLSRSYFPSDCRFEYKSMARTILALGRIDYITRFVQNSLRYIRAMRIHPHTIPNDETIELIKHMMIQAESFMRNNTHTNILPQPRHHG